MDQKLFDHLLALAAKTGDRLIVVDPATQRPFVLMGVIQYEQLTGAAGQWRQEAIPATGAAPISVPDTFVPPALVDDELTAWRSEQAGTSSATSAATTVEGFSPEPLQAAASEDERFYVEPLE